jgi:hypothetical protein
VAITGVYGDKVRAEAEASVDGAAVATAVLVGARLARPLPPPR